MASGIEIFIDESGDFGQFDARCPYYIVTMVFHETTCLLFSHISELEYRLSLIGLEEHCIHSSPAVRGEREYHGIDLATRRKMMSCFSAFVRKSGLSHKCFFVEKRPSDTESDTVARLRGTIEPFLSTNEERLMRYSQMSVSYDKGQRPLLQLITEIFAERFHDVRIIKTLPVFSRIFQMADYVCTMNRLAFKLRHDGCLSKSETRFFGNIGNFRKKWLKSLMGTEWRQ